MRVELSPEEGTSQKCCFGGSFLCVFFVFYCFFFSIVQDQIQPVAARHKGRASREQEWVAGGKGGAEAFPSSAAPAETVA